MKFFKKIFDSYSNPFKQMMTNLDFIRSGSFVSFIIISIIHLLIILLSLNIFLGLYSFIDDSLYSYIFNGGKSLVISLISSAYIALDFAIELGLILFILCILAGFWVGVFFCISVFREVALFFAKNGYKEVQWRLVAISITCASILLILSYLTEESSVTTSVLIGILSTISVASIFFFVQLFIRFNNSEG